MPGPFTGAGKARLVQPGDPVASQIIDQPLAVILRRIAALEALVQSEAASVPQALIIYNVPIDDTVDLNDVVYYNPATGNYSEAIATVTLINNTFNANPSALGVGIAVAVNGSSANIQVGGIGAWLNSSQAQGMMQSGETFQAGAPYYLSATQPGKLTRFPPLMRVQILLTTGSNFIVSPLPSIPEAIENIYTVQMGMRPVGAIRAIPPDYTKNIVVGFDALEYTGNLSGWQSTSQNPNSVLQNFGYMAADANITALPVSPPIYVEIDVNTNGTVTAFTANTLANLVAVGGSIYNIQYLTNITSTNFASIQGYAVQDQTGQALGLLSFKLVTFDLTYPRRVIFKFPDSFQGWKMIYAPVSPIAIPIIGTGSSAGVIQSITIQEHSSGFTTAPAATIVDTGGGTGAVLMVNLDVYGGVMSVVVVNGGSGYSLASVVVFTSAVASVCIVGGGDGGTVALTVGGTGVINSAIVLTPGSNYGSPPSLVVADSGAGFGAILQPVIQNGQLISVNVLSGGSNYTQGSGTTPTATVVPSSFGYSTPPTLITNNSNPTVPAVVALNLAPKRIQNIRIVCSGIGYTANATLTLTDSGTGSPAPSAVVVGYTDANGSIYQIKVLNPGGYGTVPTLSPSVPSSGYGAQFIVTLASAISSATVSSAGSGYQGIPSFQIGAALSQINITNPGGGYQPGIAPSVTISAPDDTVNGVQAVGTAVLGGTVARANVISAGSGYATPANVTINVNVATAIANISAGALIAPSVVVPGTGYTGFPTVVVTGGSGTGGILTATLSGGAVTGFTIVEAGSGYTSPPTITIAPPPQPAFPSFTPIIQGGALISVEITNPGNNFVVPLALTVYDTSVSPGSGAIVNCNIEGSGTVVGVTLTTAGNGYVNPPLIILSGPVDSADNPIQGGWCAQAASVLSAGPAEAIAILTGEGGSRMPQSVALTQGNNLQVFDFHDDLDTPGSPFPDPQSSSVFYYNIKADPLMTLRYPPNPIEKVQAVANGVELFTLPYNTATGGYADPDTDIGISTETPFWTTFDLDGSPWDRNWQQYVQQFGVSGNDAIIQNSGPVGMQAAWWRFWENVFVYSTSRSKGWLHINKASQFYQTNKITSLGCLSPLRLIDVQSGVESTNDGTPQVGQLLLTIDGIDNFVGGTGTQIDMTVAGNAQAIYTNNTGTAVLVTSVVMLVVFQSSSPGAASTANNTAQITIGTAAGSYRDYVGATSATVANTWLSAINQFKEFVPDPQIGAPVLQPGLSLFVNIVQPVGAPITAQLTACKVKGLVI